MSAIFHRHFLPQKFTILEKKYQITENNTHKYFTKHQKVRTVKLYMAKNFSRPLEDSVVQYHFHN
jgi:hypothetical protein